MSFEFIICVVFWSLIYPFEDFSGSTISVLRTYMDHIAPVSMLLIDYILNLMIFNPRHVYIQLIIMVVYMIVNCIVTLETGSPVYSILTWQDWLTVILVPCQFIFTTLTFLVFSYVSIYKQNKQLKVLEARKLNQKARL